MCIEAAGLQPIVQLNHRDLEDVGCTALNGHVYGRAFCRVLYRLVNGVLRQLGKVAPAPHNRFDIAALSGLCYCVIQVASHAGKACKVSVDKLAGFFRRKVGSGRQPVPAHPVHETKVNRLGHAALLISDVVEIQPKDRRCCGGVYVLVALKSRDHLRILRNVRQHA